MQKVSIDPFRQTMRQTGYWYRGGKLVPISNKQMGFDHPEFATSLINNK